jgi:hypothetical protein
MLSRFRISISRKSFGIILKTKLRIMKKLSLLLIVLMTMSCGCVNSENNQKTRDAKSEHVSTSVMLERVSQVMADSTATPKAVSDAVLPLADRLLEMVKDEDKNKRVGALGLSQELLMDIMFKFNNLTKGESELLHECLSALGRVGEQWAVVKGADGTFTLTKEIVYVSYQGTDYSKEGVITIQVTPPASTEQEPYVKVTFPSTAVTSPVMVFSRYKSSEEMEEDREGWKQVEFDQWWGKEQLGAGIPLMASARSNLILRMLEYDTVYISFISEDVSEKFLGGYEAARISLNSFKEEYLKHQHDNYRYF